MTKRLAVLISTLFVLLAFAGVAAAQKVRVIKGKDRVVYKKKTVVDFESAMVEGELVKPEGSYMITRGRTRFKSLITMRTNFVDAIKKHARTL